MERPAARFAGFAGFDGGQTAASNAVKNTRLGHVAAKVVALERPAGRVKWFQGRCSMWLRMLLPWKACGGVALERPAAWFGGFDGFAGFERGQTAASNAVKNTWLGHVAAKCSCESCCLGKACGGVWGV